MDGASWVQRLRHVYWPQTGTALALSGYVGFLLCLWDVETAVLIQPPGGQTMALRIFNFLHYGHGTQVNALCVVVLMLALLPLIAGTWLFRTPKSIHSQCPDGI
jgi:iron(III) transport system permease protein